MQYTPRDILNYVYEKELDTQFLLATANHVQDFSIGEITDKKIEKRGEDFLSCFKVLSFGYKNYRR